VNVPPENEIQSAVPNVGEELPVGSVNYLPPMSNVESEKNEITPLMNGIQEMVETHPPELGEGDHEKLQEEPSIDESVDAPLPEHTEPHIEDVPEKNESTNVDFLPDQNNPMEDS
jgi:hypothetical protein